MTPVPRREGGGGGQELSPASRERRGHVGAAGRTSAVKPGGRAPRSAVRGRGTGERRRVPRCPAARRRGRGVAWRGVAGERAGAPPPGRRGGVRAHAEHGGRAGGDGAAGSRPLGRGGPDGRSVDAAAPAEPARTRGGPGRGLAAGARALQRPQDGRGKRAAGRPSSCPEGHLRGAGAGGRRRVPVRGRAPAGRAPPPRGSSFLFLGVFTSGLVARPRGPGHGEGAEGCGPAVCPAEGTAFVVQETRAGRGRGRGPGALFAVPCTAAGCAPPPGLVPPR